ncbi:MAG: rhomboid family intramembrane serine protease [Luteococcus sp.]|nr:rhomboid family intramembrane serine protease [Luteococcus sp.]MDN5562314.1 rhomboid family intramembrane serine protease [Luteococcus sp.]
MSQPLVPVPARNATDTRRSLQLAGIPVGLMWALEAIDTATFHLLDRFGLQSWDLDGLWGMFTAPWLHLGWQHLMNNSVPLLVLGFLVALSGIRRWLLTTLVVVLTSGLAAWLLSPPGTMTMGASGVVFGWLTYLLARAWWSRDWRQVLIGVVVFVVYGSVLWGVLPADQAVSWQGHLGGAAGGILAARMLHGRRAS